LRKKFWLEVIGYFSDDFNYTVKILTKSQIRVILKNGEIIDFYPVGEKICWVKKGVYETVVDIEKFIQTVDVVGSPQSKKQKGLTVESLMPIGKHKGIKIKDLPKAYLKYIYEMEYTSPEIMNLIKSNPDLIK